MPHSISDHYPELMHYTTAAGLTGIVTSGLLWATHINFLNDSEEFNHFFDERLPHLFAKYMEIIDSDSSGSSGDTEERSRKVSGELKQATLGVCDSYIFSLCAASDERIAAQGLLSQWRGYGMDGGYAIVFDTNGLEDLAKHKPQPPNLPILLGEVMYSDEGEAYAKLAKKVTDGIAMLPEKPESLLHLWEATTQLAAFHKHWGFEEEREVRLVAFWPTHELAKSLGARLPKSFIRGGAPVPYLELFADKPDGSKCLPIKRVIVGPHRDQTLRIDAVQRLLAANGYAGVAVRGSAIPYLGR